MQTPEVTGHLDWGREEEFLQSVFLRSHSIHSKRFYWSGLEQFKKFCREEKVPEVNDRNVYDVLNAFVRWNDAKGNRPRTIIDYLCAAKRFLLYQDVSIEENRYRSKVVVPRSTKIEDQPLSVETIRRLLSHGRPNVRMRALILLLASSGMRLAEALNLKVGDLDLVSSPGKIHIRAEYSKTRRERWAYVSDEAKEALARQVAGAPPARLVFHWWGDTWQREKMAFRTFKAVRERAGLDEKFDYRNGFRKVHFHLFRKFFLTKASDVIGEHAAHALCGHGFYMDTYYRKSEEEREADYLRLMPHLTFLSRLRYREEDVANRVKREMLRAAGYSQKELERLDPSKLEDDEQLQRMMKERLLGPVAVKGGVEQRQKVVPADEAERWITQGWEWIGNLADGRAVLRLTQQPQKP